VDQTTRDALVAEDASSAELLKPVLRGRDIARYRANWKDLWLIDTHNGFADVPSVKIEDYPAIKVHLDRFIHRLERRQDQGDTPYNLRNCAYHEEFRREKLFWMHMSQTGRFAHDNSGMYCNQKCFIMTGGYLKYLCAILNSSLITWLMKSYATTTGMGVTQWDKFSVISLPIPLIPTLERQSLTDISNDILKRKTIDPTTNTSEHEAEIDKLVYGLYGLTSKEINIVNRYKII